MDADLQSEHNAHEQQPDDTLDSHQRSPQDMTVQQPSSRDTLCHSGSVGLSLSSPDAAILSVTDAYCGNADAGSVSADQQLVECQAALTAAEARCAELGEQLDRDRSRLVMLQRQLAEAENRHQDEVHKVGAPTLVAGCSVASMGL